MRLYNISRLVEEVLRTKPQARNDDYFLWVCVLEICAKTYDHHAEEMTVGEFLRIVKYLPVPKYETVSRSRRKLQSEFPELKGTAETQESREQQEEIYRKYAKANLQNFLKKY